MPTKKVVFFFALFAITGTIIFAFLWFKSLPTPSSRLEAEQMVYKVLLAHEPHFIGEYTLSGYDCTSKTCVQSLLEDFPKLKRQTIVDFQANDKQSYPLKDYLPLTIGNGVINPAKNELNRQQISLSRIAFDPFLTQALVLVEDCRGEGCFDSAINSMYSIGSFIFLLKVNDKWIIQKEKDAYLIEAPSP